jgi:hypothetical protein
MKKITKSKTRMDAASEYLGKGPLPDDLLRVKEQKKTEIKSKIEQKKPVS